MRWQHPDDGLVFPDVFIGVAEENGLIDELTRVVLIAELEQSRRWRDEGVEDREDWNFLRQQGCDLAQGYFIARPMPAGKLRAWLAGWDARHTELLPE